MRYLWIEDFNEGKDESELKTKWIKYYGLQKSHLIIKKTLNSALKYIEENPKGFDGVLLDINLPVGVAIEGKSYKDYIKEIISNEYLEQDSKHIQAKAGFLIFLKLMIDLKFPKDRIVFISGNVDSAKIIEIDNMITFYIYYLYNKKTKNYREFEAVVDKVDEHYDDFQSYKADLKREYPEISKKLDAVIEEYNDLEECIKLLRKEKFELFESKISSKDDDESKRNTYNRMEPIFLKAGFNPPRAFEKPSDSIYDELNWEFFEWKKSIEHPYYELRSSIIEMCEILINRFKNIDKNNKEKLILFNDLYINSFITDAKKNMYSQKYFEELLRYLQMLFPSSLPSENERRNIYKQIIREITHDWETAINVYYPSKEVFDRNKYKINNRRTDGSNYKLYEKCENFRDFAQKSAYGAIMKTLRNWTAHSRLREFSEDEVGFIFIIAMRSFFNIDNKFYLDDPDNYYNYELKLLQLANKCLKHHELECKFKKQTNRNNNEYYREIEYELKRSFHTLSDDDYKKYQFTHDVYAKVRNIGDEDSKKECRIDHIYRLFWHFMFNSYIDYYKSDYSKPNLKFCGEDELYVTDKEDVLTYLYMYSYYKAFI